MSACNQCGAPLGVRESCFPGWKLLACTGCGRPVKLLPDAGPRPRSDRQSGRRYVNRSLRAARRAKARQQ